MTLEMAVDVLRQTFLVCLIVVSPIMVAAIAVGVIVSLLQSLTSIQEQTLTFVPKLVVVCFIIIGFANWMIAKVTEFAVINMSAIAQLGGA